MQVKTDAHLNEYVIDSDKVGTLTVDNTKIAYTHAEGAKPAISVPTDEINTIVFERNQTLTRSRMLACFFLAVTLGIIWFTYLIVFAGDSRPANWRLYITLWGLLIIGGISVTYRLFKSDEHDVIDMYIHTDETVHTVCATIENKEFVEACQELNESSINTVNEHKTLESEFSD